MAHESTPLVGDDRKASSFRDKISASKSTIPLALLCLTTGLTNYPSYTSTRVWTGFLTGLTLQLGAAIPTVLQTRHVTTANWHQVISLCSFGLAAYLGGIIKRKLGSTSRREIVTRSLMELMALLIASLALLTSTRGAEDWSDPTGFICQGLLSFVNGMQALDGQTLNSEFATTVVQTSVWLGYFSLPTSTHLYAGRKNARDYRLLAAAMLLLGGCLSQVFLSYSSSLRKGQGSALIAAFVVRTVATIYWLFLGQE